MFAKAIRNTQGSPFMVRDGPFPQDPLQLALGSKLQAEDPQSGAIWACTPRYGSYKVFSTKETLQAGGKGDYTRRLEEGELILFTWLVHIPKKKVSRLSESAPA